jgi:O-antigen ligase
MFALVVLTFLFAMAPVSSSAINLTWIFLFLFSGWVFVGRRYDRCQPGRAAEIRSALTVLIATFLLGLVLMILMRLYWSESVRGVSFELTALVAAAISLVFATSWSANEQHRKTVGIGIFVASLLALAQGYGYMFTNHPGPTNPVNWGAGMALVVCVALSAGIRQETNKQSQWLAVVSVLVFSLAIFVAGRRGAFFAIFWCATVGSYFLIRDLALNWRTTRHLLVLPTVLVVVSVTTLLAKDQLAAPLDRVLVAASEVKALAGDESDRALALRSSVGSRFHMVKLGLEAGAASPWVGVGADGLASVVKRAELDVQAPLFHLHNEYLQAWVAYGIAGLLASLCFPTGLVVAGFLLRHAAPAPALAMAGLGLVHFFSGLSNVNTFHNYYGTVFAVCVAFPFLTFVPKPISDHPVTG